jgi:steroid delta-isomerase-like uncharacterized protein
MAALAALSAGCATAGASASPDTIERETLVIDAFLAAYQNRDVPAAMALMSDDVYFEDPTMHLVARNREELRAITQQGADGFSDIRITPFNRIHASPWTILQQRIAGNIRRPDGQARAVDVQGLSMFEIREGKIFRWYDYYDVLAFRQQTR